jgi:DNA-binding NtrC family response regulator
MERRFMTMRWRMLAICSIENRQAIENAVTEWSLEICWCLTLQEARRGLRRGNHALVLCEAELPDGTYRDVMKLLKRELDQVRVIILSPSENCYSQAIEMGAFDVISSPCSRTDVQWMIMQAVQGHPATTHGSRKDRSQGGRSSFAFV